MLFPDDFATETEAVLRRYYAALKSADDDVLRDVITDDIEVHYQDAAGLLPWGGLWQGRAGFRAFLSTVADYLSSDRVQPVETRFVGECAIVVLNGEWTAKASGRRIAATVVNLFETRDGRICRYRVFPDTAAFALALGTVRQAIDER